MDSIPDRPAPPRSATEAALEWLRWFGLIRLVVTICAVVAVCAGGFWLLRSPAPPIENSLPFASSVPDPSVSSAPGQTLASAVTNDATTDTPPSPAAMIVVHVAGAVFAPGVYQLANDARVQQAIIAAGGMTVDADPDAVNQAGFLTDGDRVYIPLVGQPVPTVVLPSGGTQPSNGSASGTPTAVSATVDLNRASVSEFDGLPGIGPSTAAAIVAYRETNGPYLAVEDLLAVRGIGPAKLDAIRALITV